MPSKYQEFYYGIIYILLVNEGRHDLLSNKIVLKLIENK
jgi:hypothetical protein